MTTILIKNGHIVDPANGLNGPGDVLIANDKIAAVGKLTSAQTKKAEKIIDATGLLVTPGLIDMHVHLREPGDEEVETIASGSAAAVAGGFTSVACMPNTDPAIDNEATVDFVERQATRAGLANVFAVGTITKERKGEELAEMGQMVRGGAVAFSDDGSGVANPSVLLQAFKYASMFDKAILEHCEDKQLATGVMNAGYQASVLGLPGINPLAEELMLYRDIQLAKQAKARLHAQHISTVGSIEVLRRAKAEGAKVTAEVTPHHLLLTEDACCRYDTNTKMNPPLRRQEDIMALRGAVADGIINCLASDHAPHSCSSKELEFLQAPFGIISLDVALGLYVKALIEPNVIDWPRLIEMMTVAPAKILRLNKGTLSVNADADVTLIDRTTSRTVDITTFRSKSRNCPYHGWSLKGWAMATIVGGAVKYRREV